MVSLEINEEDFDNPGIQHYASYLITNYPANKDRILRYIYNDLKEFYNYIPEAEFVQKVGNPTISILSDNDAEFVYLESQLDEHLITLEVTGNYELSYVTCDG